mmetsp:Transcript_21302/g.66779  ORF Transcript_21302/g.66779 Transcript_21302/m.66779 type:complete len:265 (-) Transcript_21302:378-1172(-)
MSCRDGSRRSVATRNRRSQSFLPGPSAISSPSTRTPSSTPRPTCSTSPDPSAPPATSNVPPSKIGASTTSLALPRQPVSGTAELFSKAPLPASGSRGGAARSPMAPPRAQIVPCCGCFPRRRRRRRPSSSRPTQAEDGASRREPPSSAGYVSESALALSPVSSAAAAAATARLASGGMSVGSSTRVEPGCLVQRRAAGASCPQRTSGALPARTGRNTLPRISPRITTLASRPSVAIPHSLQSSRAPKSVRRALSSSIALAAART